MSELRAVGSVFAEVMAAIPTPASPADVALKAAGETAAARAAEADALFASAAAMGASEPFAETPAQSQGELFDP
jgi:hypothetical protein